MKRLRFVWVSALVSLLLIGCADNQPSFDPNNKGFIVVDGNVYRVPLEANYNAQAFKSDTDKGVVKGRESGLDCKKGDVFWISTKAQKAVYEAKLDGDVNLAASLVLEAPRKRQVGCAHPLTRKEFEYYKNKQL